MLSIEEYLRLETLMNRVRKVLPSQFGDDHKKNSKEIRSRLNLLLKDFGYEDEL